MNAPLGLPQGTAVAALPAEFEILAPTPPLLPGESLERYYLMRQAILADIAPQSAVEWLLAIDVVELSWEIQRYQLLRQKILERFRQSAIEHSLRQIDLACIPQELECFATLQTQRNARSWRFDPETARQIEARLAAHGIDVSAINAEVYIQARDAFVIFEALINSTQNRRVSLLREISFQRRRG